MQIVIDIPKSEIPNNQAIIEIPLHFIDGKVCEAGGYGFAELPKGHGKLIDADELKKIIQENDVLNMTGFNVRLCDINNTPTIIEADTESEGER